MEATISQNIHHFNNLFHIISQYPEGYFAEGNIWFEGGGSIEVSKRFEHKRQNIFNLAKKHNRILEIGFNAGHSSLLMLLANPKCSIVAFDLGEHPYTKHCFKYLSDTFGSNRINIIYGDSTQTVLEYALTHPTTKFDMLHLDGGHDQHILVQDVYNSRMLADPSSHVVIVDDDDFHDIHWWNRVWSKNRLFISYDFPEIITKDDGSMDHYIAQYRFQ